MENPADISESVKVYCRIRPPLPNEVRDDSGKTFWCVLLAIVEVNIKLCFVV